MADRFTGFWEAVGKDADGELVEEVRTTVGPIELEDLMGRLYARLYDLPPGVNVRIDLISWGPE